MTVVPPKKTSGFGLSHVGRVRYRNEDSIYIDPEGRFGIVADGMGGHKGGAEASKMTIECIKFGLDSTYEDLESFSIAEVSDFIIALFMNTSRNVYESGRQNSELEGMGCTLVLWLKIADKVYLAHVGDSRAYLFRNNKIFQITIDHSLENEQIKLGIPRNQINSFPMRHAIYRSIGSQFPQEPYLLFIDAKDNDLWLLCTDGLTNKLANQEIEEILLMQKTLSDKAQYLVNEAWLRGGDDNISVLLIN